MSSLTVHIGYHKTGTTWVQRSFLLPEFGFQQVISTVEVFPWLVQPHSLDFDVDQAKHFLSERMNAVPTGLSRVISSEILVGNPFFGGRESESFARRLQRVAPDAKILITIREQLAALVSLYMQYVSRGGKSSPKSFFEERPDVGYNTFSAGHFEYHKLVLLYCELFGSENVKVMTHESLVRDYRDFVTQVWRFAGVQEDLPYPSSERVSASAKEFALAMLRGANHFRRGPVGDAPLLDLGRFGDLVYRGAAGVSRRDPLKSLFRNWKPVSRFVDDRFTGRFTESNRVLRSQLRDDIDMSGYMC